jgi:hypothetical protein
MLDLPAFASKRMQCFKFASGFVGGESFDPTFYRTMVVLMMACRWRAAKWSDSGKADPLLAAGRRRIFGSAHAGFF